MAIVSLAATLSARKQFREAVPLYRQAVALKPGFPIAHFGLAGDLAQLGAYDEAEVHFRKALEIDPLFWQARIDLAIALVDQGKIVESLEQAQILSRAEAASDFPHKAFGILLARAGCPDGAKVCFEAHLARNPDAAEEMSLLLAAVGCALPPRTPEAQVVRLYAECAERWDAGSTGPTGYRGHRLVADAVDQLHPGPVDAIIDAGCGTGLVGELLRGKARHLAGIDMSEAMLVQARAKKVYDELRCADLVEYLGRHANACDIITSAATLIHFGDLNSVFAAAASCLKSNGLFAFTVFPNDEDPDAVAAGTLDGLAQGGCFRHGSGYIARMGEQHGFRIELSRREPHEFRRGSPILASVLVLRLTR